jgi:hypothetical protein
MSVHSAKTYRSTGDEIYGFGEKRGSIIAKWMDNSQEHYAMDE